jgi:hypothetical protein
MKNCSFIKFFKARAKIFLLSLLFSSSGFAQVNLIPNGDFEDLKRNTLDTLFSGIYAYMPPWNGTNCMNYMGAEAYSERFTHSLMYPWRVPINHWGYQYAQSGNSYAGILLYRNDSNGVAPNYNPAWNFLGNKLRGPLKPGLPYYFSFYFNLADNSGLAINKISVHFTKDSTLCKMDSASYLFYSPFEPLIRVDTTIIHTDSLNWTHYEKVFMSDSSVQIMYLGCLDKYYQVKFDTVNSTFDPITAYYYFDNFELYELHPYLGNDTSLCPNDSGYLISAHQGFDSYLWSTGDTGRSLRVYNSGQYWVKASWKNYTLYDTIQVTFFPVPEPQILANSFIVAPGIMQLQSVGGYQSYLWSNGATTAFTNTNATGSFWLQATTAEGCVVTDTLEIKSQNLALIIPSLVASNEAFNIKNLPPNCRLSIFNEAGQIVYYSENFQNCCIPKLAAGMYFVDLLLNDENRIKAKVIFH